MTVPLLLDEMHGPVVAERLRGQGHDVVSVDEDASLRGLSDAELFTWAARERRRIVTENVRDFRPLLRQAEEARHPLAPLLFTSSRTFPRSRRNIRPLVKALEEWLGASDAPDRPVEDWLMPAERRGR